MFSSIRDPIWEPQNSRIEYIILIILLFIYMSYFLNILNIFVSVFELNIIMFIMFSFSISRSSIMTTTGHHIRHVWVFYETLQGDHLNGLIHNATCLCRMIKNHVICRFLPEFPDHKNVSTGTTSHQYAIDHEPAPPQAETYE